MKPLYTLLLPFSLILISLAVPGQGVLPPQQVPDLSIPYTLAYVSSAGEVVTCSVNGTTGPSLHNTKVQGGYLAWSPDGKQIAFYAKYDDRKTWSIHTMNADGSNWKRLTHARHKWDSAPDWSPDGKKIVFAREYRDTDRLCQGIPRY